MLKLLAKHNSGNTYQVEKKKPSVQKEHKDFWRKNKGGKA